MSGNHFPNAEGRIKIHLHPPTISSIKRLDLPRKRFIRRALERARGNQSRAAKELGIHRNTLSRMVDEYKLDHRSTGRAR